MNIDTDPDPKDNRVVGLVFKSADVVGTAVTDSDSTRTVLISAISKLRLKMKDEEKKTKKYEKRKSRLWKSVLKDFNPERDSRILKMSIGLSLIILVVVAGMAYFLGYFYDLADTLTDIFGFWMALGILGVCFAAVVGVLGLYFATVTGREREDEDIKIHPDDKK